PRTTSGVSRRSFMRLGGSPAGGGLLPACPPPAPAAPPAAPTTAAGAKPTSAPPAPAQAAPTSAAAAPTKFSEAPVLAQMVQAGKLPPVEQRLPASPQVVQPVQGVGQYGGTWRLAWTGPADFQRFGFYAPKHYLTRFHAKYNNGPNDYKVFTDKAGDLPPGRPLMTAWHVTSWAAGDRRLVADRNPHYRRVDPHGNQLPYI